MLEDVFSCDEHNCLYMLETSKPFLPLILIEWRFQWHEPVTCEGVRFLMGLQCQKNNQSSSTQGNGAPVM